MAPRMGDGGLEAGFTLPLRRAFASQLEIWLLFRPVSCFNSSFSRSVGYGCSECSASHPFNTLTESLPNLAPFFRGLESSYDLRALLPWIEPSHTITSSVMPGKVLMKPPGAFW